VHGEELGWGRCLGDGIPLVTLYNVAHLRIGDFFIGGVCQEVIYICDLALSWHRVSGWMNHDCCKSK
jgi:hypothetical protein